MSYIPETSPGVSDSEVLQRAHDSDAILITGDKDSGALVFQRKLQNHGVVLLRSSGLSEDRKVAIVLAAFLDYSDGFAGSLAVITQHGVRVRRQT